MNSKKSSLYKIFFSEIEENITKYALKKPEVFSESEIAKLPEPVKRYFKSCGYIGKEKINAAQIEWKSAYLKMSPKKKWKKIECNQYNSVFGPTRIVYMKSTTLGLFSFEGRDKYHNGKGKMLIKLMKKFTVGNALGAEIDASALVTILAEVFLLPNYALQPYIKWKSIDAHSAEASLTCNNIKVTGIFHFNDRGEMIQFDTNDRYHSERDGTFRKIKWSCKIGNYIEKDGIKFPTEILAYWHFDSETVKLRNFDLSQNNHLLGYKIFLILLPLGLLFDIL
jgi:hypothetical protein